MKCWDVHLACSRWVLRLELWRKWISERAKSSSVPKQEALRTCWWSFFIWSNPNNIFPEAGGQWFPLKPILPMFQVLEIGIKYVKTQKKRHTNVTSLKKNLKKSTNPSLVLWDSLYRLNLYLWLPLHSLLYPMHLVFSKTMEGLNVC